LPFSTRAGSTESGWLFDRDLTDSRDGGAQDANREGPGLFTRAAIYDYALSEHDVSKRYRSLNNE